MTPEGRPPARAPQPLRPRPDHRQRPTMSVWGCNGNARKIVARAGRVLGAQGAPLPTVLAFVNWCLEAENYDDVIRRVQTRVRIA